MQKFYVTTPIYYVNDKPHIGHAYTSIAADILARYHRMRGKDVLFLTGTDENAQKNAEAAEKNGMGDNVQGYVDKMSAVWQETFDELGLTHNRFIRTTEEDHKQVVKKFWEIVKANGDIYEGEYEGLYCLGCEAFKVESDLVDGLCPDHKKVPEQIKEKNYFFRLTKYRDALLDHIEQHPEFIQPKKRRNEVISYITNFMEDVSISRTTMKWGIPVPDDDGQRIYVWFDALLNYLTGAGYGKDDEFFKRMWPADVHLVGKDIIKFHCAIWPAMLMSAGLALPKKVFAHGFFTVNGEKMSKSLGNVVDPVGISKEKGIDVLRFYLMREIRFGEDGDFSHNRLQERYDSELANELGNLVSRVLAMTEKYLDGIVPEPADGFLAGAWQAYDQAMDDIDLHSALEIAMKLVREANQFIEQKRPWELAKMGEDKILQDTLYILLETIRHIAWLIYPFMPETAPKIFTKLGQTFPKEFSQSTEEAWKWGGLKSGTKVKKGESLFPKTT